MNETNEAESKLPKVFFLESIHNIENQPQRKLKKSNTNTILKRKKTKNVTSILKKEATMETNDFIFVSPDKIKTPKNLNIVDIVSVKQKLEKFLEKVRRKKILEEVKKKLEENLNPNSKYIWEEPDEDAEKEELKAFSEIHKLLKLRNIKNEPFFLELEELFSFKSIFFEAIFHEDDKPLLFWRNLVNAVRRLITYMSLIVVTNRVYIMFTMSIILANSIEIGLTHKDSESKIPHFLYFNGFYIAEIMLKVCAYGFFFQETSYLRDKWNVLDIFAFLLTLIFDKILSKEVNFMPMRLFRLVDYLEIKQVQYLFDSLFYSLRFLLETFSIFCFFVFIAGVISLHIFSGIFSKHCFDSISGIDLGDFCGNSNCISQAFCAEALAKQDLTNFDDIFHSLLLTMRIVTLDDWTSLLNSTQEAFSNYTWFFFFIVVSVGNFFFINLIIAALKINFVIASENLGKRPKKLSKKPKNPMILKRKMGKFEISLKRYNLKLMKVYHLHKHIDLHSKILSHHNVWTVDTKASSIYNSIKSFFSRMVRASFFVHEKKESAEKIRSNSEISHRSRKLYSNNKKMKTTWQNEKIKAKGSSVFGDAKKKSAWMDNFVLKSAFVESKKKKEHIDRMNQELKNKYLKVRVKSELEFKSSSTKDILPSKTLQELIAQQEMIIQKNRKQRIYYDFSSILSEIGKEDFYSRSGKLSQNFTSSMRLPLSSRSSFQIKCFKILAERQKHDLKSFIKYSSIIAKNITQRFMPMFNPNQNYIEKRNKQRKVKPENTKEKPTKKETFKEDFESPYSMQSNMDRPSIGKQKNKSVYFGSPSSKDFSHQNSAMSQTGRSGGLRKSLFSRKREVKVNIFTDCYGNEHGFDEMKIVVNKMIENKSEDAEEFHYHEEYLKIRDLDLENKMKTFDVWSGYDVNPKFNPYAIIGIFESLNEKFNKNLNFTLQRIKKKSMLVVNTPLFQWFFIVPVFPNVIILSLQRILDQEIIDITNFAISFLFLIEIIMKGIAYGLQGLLKSKRNFVECILLLYTLFSVVYINANQNSEESQLLRIGQSFTILRTIKIFALIDYMHFIMKVISNSFANFSLIALSLVVFIIIYALLGMQIFINEDSTFSQRQSNFQNFSLSFIQVFDLITLDNWYSFIKESIQDSENIIVFLRVSYVITLIFICNFIMLNLFIDLLCQHFENLNIMKEEEKPDIHSMIRSRSTQLSTTTKSKLRILEEELDFDENLSSMSSFDEENFNKLIKKMFVPTLTIKSNKTPNSSDNEKIDTSPKKSILFSILQDSITRRISEDNLSRNGEASPSPLKKSGSPSNKTDLGNSNKDDPIKKRKDTFSFSKKDLQKKIDATPKKVDTPKGDEEVSFPKSIPTVQRISNKAREKNSIDSIFSSPSIPQIQNFENRLIERMEFSVRNSEVLDNTTKHREAKNQNDIGKFLKTVLANFEDEEEFTYLKEVKCQFSLFLFSKENAFRKLCFKILINRLFHYFMNGVTLLSMFKLIIDSYVDENEQLISITEGLNYFINISFLTEAFIKIVAFGLFMDEMSYFRNLVNVLEFINSLGFILQLATNVEILKSLLLFRMLRPLNFISNNKDLKLVFEALLRSFAQIINIIMIVILVWLIFGVIGVSVFGNNFGYCMSPENFGISCNQCKNNWINHKYNFDNIYQAMCTLFVLSTFDGWSDILKVAVNSAPPEQGPIQYNNQYRSYFYFLLFIIVGVWFFMNFIIGVIFSNFLESQNSERHKYLNNDQHLWLQIQKKILKEKPLNYILPQGQISQFVYKLIKTNGFRNTIHFLLLLNAVYLSIYYHNSSPTYNLSLSIIAYILTIAYCFEVCFHCMAYGIHGYLSFKNGFFKILIACCYLIETLIGLVFQDYFAKETQKSSLMRFFSIFHVLVMIRLFQKFKNLKKLIKSLSFSSKHVISTIILLLLIYFVYAVLGCFLFGKIKNGEVINDYINFKNFFSAIVTLFTCSTQDNWSQIMNDCSNVCINQDLEKNCGSSWAKIYFYSFMFLVGHVLLNMIILILMQAFEEFYLNPDQPLRFYSDYVKKFKVFWSKHCLLEFNYYLDEKNVISFYGSLGEPMGIEPDDPFKNSLKKLMKLKIFINEKGFAFFNEVLYVTMKNLYLKKIYVDGIDRKTKNYLIHQENLFYKSLTKHKEFTMRNFKIVFDKNNEKDKSVRFFRRIMSIYVLLLFWRKYTEIFMEASQKNTDTNLSKLKLVEEVFNDDDELQKNENNDKFSPRGNRSPKNPKSPKSPARQKQKMSEILGQKCERSESVFQPSFMIKEKRKDSMFKILPKYIGKASPKDKKNMANFLDSFRSNPESKNDL